jgi:hypothetical protein
VHHHETHLTIPARDRVRDITDRAFALLENPEVNLAVQCAADPHLRRVVEEVSSWSAASPALPASLRAAYAKARTGEISDEPLLAKIARWDAAKKESFFDVVAASQAHSFELENVSVSEDAIRGATVAAVNQALPKSAE